MEFLGSQKSKTFIKIGSGLTLIYVTANFAKRKFTDWKETDKLANARKKRGQQRADQFTQLQRDFQQLDNQTKEKYEQLANCSIKELQEKLFKRELLAEELLKACIWNSLKAQEEFNCITEFLPDALGKAKALDKMHMLKGPLHGLPFAVKDDTAIAGFDCTLGCSVLLNKPSTQTAVIVQALESLGAIPFCRTNVPQTCISLGSSNPIFGKTLNPLRKSLGPGGSSSGTACLVAARGCPFGTGSDTGGSLRVPAHFCGISTIKATSGRLSRRGVSKCLDTLPAVPGVLAKSGPDVALLFQALTEQNLQNKMDSNVVPLSWNAQAFDSKQKLRIGYISGHSQFEPLGDSKMVVDRAKTFLESTGHILIPFEPPMTSDTFTGLNSQLNIGEVFEKLVKHDEISDSIKIAYDSILQSCLSKLFPCKNDGKVVPNREELMDAFLDKMNEAEIDIIISPVLPFPSISIEKVPIFEDILIYTLLWNWMDFPAGVVKFWTESGINWNSSIDCCKKSGNWEKVLKDNAKDSVGMPIGVQVIGRPFQEELVLKMMVELDDINKL